jgi:hypothetical protein
MSYWDWLPNELHNEIFALRDGQYLVDHKEKTKKVFKEVLWRTKNISWANSSPYISGRGVVVSIPYKYSKVNQKIPGYVWEFSCLLLKKYVRIVKYYDTIDILYHNEKYSSVCQQMIFESYKRVQYVNKQFI